MRINDYPNITTLASTDLLLVQTASDKAYKNIMVSDLKKSLGNNESTTTGTVPGTNTNTSTDEYYAQVSLLLPFDGDSGSTVIADLKGHAINRQGNPVITTAQGVFNGSALYLDGYSSLSIAQDTSLTFGSADFTWECWIYMVTNPNSANFVAIMGNAAGGGSGNAGMFLAINSGKLVLRHWVNANDMAISTGSLTYGAWYHVAATRRGTMTNVFLDGQIGQAGIVEAYNTDNTFTIGTVPGNSGYASNLFGYVDELRVTNSKARYTSSFTVPTQPFPTK